MGWVPPPAGSLAERVVELEGRVALLEKVIYGLQVHQREQQQSPLISEERTAEECQVLPARGIRVGQAGKRWLQASTFDEESHAAVAGAVAELAKPTT